MLRSVILINKSTYLAPCTNVDIISVMFIHKLLLVLLECTWESILLEHILHMPGRYFEHKTCLRFIEAKLNNSAGCKEELGLSQISVLTRCSRICRRLLIECVTYSVFS